MDYNVVLVTIDSLRADRSTPDAGLMPNLTQLAAEGVSYEQAFSNGYSTPVSFPSIMTGTYPDQYGGMEYMSDARPFLARRLNEEGYATAAFHSNPHLRSDCNYDVGFDFYNDFDSSGDGGSRLRYLVTQNLDANSRLYALLRRLYHFVRTTSNSADYIQAPAINAMATRWLDDEWDGDQPFFLWNHYMDVHYPFYPPDEFVDAPDGGTISTNQKLSLNGKMQENPSALTAEEREQLVALYEGDARYMDEYLGRLRHALEERNLWAETILIVTSDHGELFGEHGRYGHPPVAVDESLHVPLVFAGPGVPAGGRVTEQTALVDLAPTLASLLEINADDDWVGTDTTRYFDGSEQGRHLLLGNERVLACQTAEWRLVRYRDGDGVVDGQGDWELWDRRTGTPVDVDSNSEVVESLRESMQEYRTLLDETDEALPSVQPDDETSNQLEALGYK